MIPTKRSFPVAFAENGQTDFKLPRNFIEKKLTLGGDYTDTLSVAATSIRPRGAPVKELQLIADGGKIVHAIKFQDAIRKAEIHEQAQLGNICNPPTATTVGAKTGSFDVSLYFRQIFADGDATALPTYGYDDLTLRIFWGGHSDIFVGGTGAVTVAANAMTVTLDGFADVAVADPLALARQLDLSVDRYKEVTLAAATNDASLSIPTNANIRAIMVVAEDATTGEPLPNALTSVTLLENNTVRVYNSVPVRQLRADNSVVFGVTMPPGCFMIEFAEDRNVARDEIYRATAQANVDLFFNVSQACKVRAHLITIEPSPLR